MSQGSEYSYVLNDLSLGMPSGVWLTTDDRDAERRHTPRPRSHRPGTCVRGPASARSSSPAQGYKHNDVAVLARRHGQAARATPSPTSPARRSSSRSVTENAVPVHQPGHSHRGRPLRALATEKAGS